MSRIVIEVDAAEGDALRGLSNLARALQEISGLAKATDGALDMSVSQAALAKMLADLKLIQRELEEVKDDAQAADRALDKLDSGAAIGAARSSLGTFLPGGGRVFTAGPAQDPSYVRGVAAEFAKQIVAEQKRVFSVNYTPAAPTSVDYTQGPRRMPGGMVDYTQGSGTFIDYSQPDVQRRRTIGRVLGADDQGAWDSAGAVARARSTSSDVARELENQNDRSGGRLFAFLDLATGSGGNRGGGGGGRRGSSVFGFGGGDNKFQLGDLTRGILPGGYGPGPGATMAGGALGIGAIGQLGPAALALLAAIPALAGTATLAIAGLAAGFGGLGEAIDGDKEAFDKLSPSAQKFVQEIRGFIPELQDLQGMLRDGLFPGASEGLNSLFSPAMIEMLEQNVGQLGETLGDIIAKWGAFLGAAEQVAQIGSITEASFGWMENLSDTTMNLTDALLDVMVAAEPFLDWVFQGIEAASAWAAAWTEANPDELGEFFADAQAPIESFLDLIASAGGLLLELAAALDGPATVAMELLGDAFDELADTVRENREEIADFVTSGINVLADTVRVLWPALKDLIAVLDGVVEAVGGWETAFQFIVAGVLFKAIMGLAGGFLTLAGPAGIGAATAASGGLLGNLTKLKGIGPIAILVTLGIADAKGDLGDVVDRRVNQIIQDEYGISSARPDEGTRGGSTSWKGNYGALKPGTGALAGFVERSGGTVTAGNEPGHSATGGHPTGESLDISWSDNGPMIWAALFPHRKKFRLLLGPPGVYMWGNDYGGTPGGAKDQANHLDHIHVQYQGGPSALRDMLGDAAIPVVGSDVTGGATSSGGGASPWAGGAPAFDPDKGAAPPAPPTTYDLPNSFQEAINFAATTPGTKDDIKAAIAARNKIKADIAKMKSGPVKTDALKDLAEMMKDIQTLYGGGGTDEGYTLGQVIEEAISKASVTPQLQDDLKAFTRARNKILADLKKKGKGKLTHEQRLDARAELVRINDAIAEITDVNYSLPEVISDAILDAKETRDLADDLAAYGKAEKAIKARLAKLRKNPKKNAAEIKSAIAALKEVERTIRGLEEDIARAEADLLADPRQLFDAKEIFDTLVAEVEKYGLEGLESKMAEIRELLTGVVTDEDLDQARWLLGKLRDVVGEGVDAVLEAVRTRAAAFRSAWAELTSGALEAFDAVTNAYVSPAQAAINAIMDRREDEDLNENVDDAQKALDDYMGQFDENGNLKVDPNAGGGGGGGGGQLTGADARIDRIRATIGQYRYANDVDRIQSEILGGVHTGEQADALIKQLLKDLASPSGQSMSGGAGGLDSKPEKFDPEKEKTLRRNLERAKEDILLKGLRAQAKIETDAWDESRKKLRDSLTKSLAEWGTYYEELGKSSEEAAGLFASTWMNAINGVLGSPPAKALGLKPPGNAAEPGSGSGSGATDPSNPFGWGNDPYYVGGPGTPGQNVIPGNPLVPMAAGGIVVGRPMAALVNERPGSAGEAVIPLERLHEFMGGKGGDTLVELRGDSKWLEKLIDVRVVRLDRELSRRIGQRANRRWRAGRT